MNHETRPTTTWSRIRWGCLLLALSTAGCGRSPSVDRATAETDDDEPSIAVVKPQDAATVDSAPRLRGIRPLAKADRPLTMPARSSASGAIPTFAASTSTADPSRTTTVSQDGPLSSPIATPLPNRAVAIREAETIAAVPATLATPVRNVTTPILSPASATATAATPFVTATAAPAFDPTPQLRRAEEYARCGIASAAKGATYTARAEFLESLRLVAAANDARSGNRNASTALTVGLNALLEAEDFVGRAGQRSAPVEVAMLARTHRTAPYVAPTAMQASPAAARNAYLRFAKEQLQLAAGGTSTGSIALHGLGKIHAAGNSAVDSRGKAQTYYEAALAVGPDNFLAVNDLAVLLAEDGQLERSRDVLHAGLRRSPQPAMWANLAVVHDRLGQTQMAEAARREGQSLQARAAQPGTNILPTNNVAWLDSRNFAATSRPWADGAGSAQAAVAAKPATGANELSAKPAGIGTLWSNLGVGGKSNVVPTSANTPIRTAQQPTNRSLAY